MENYLKHYKLKIYTMAPVYIGSGQVLKKREYIYLKAKNKILVVDEAKMFHDLRRKHLENKYMEFMLDSKPRKGLEVWLREQKFRETDYEPWTLYTLDAGDVFADADLSGKEANVTELNLFIKDAYRMPYVPGSSIKGMIRTALLAYEMHKHPERYKETKDYLLQQAEYAKSGRSYLQREMGLLEAAVFHTLEKTEKRDNAVNSVMSGIIVSDSQPIARDRLTLCQKIDYTLDRNERKLPTSREVLKPGTDILFELTIDTKICKTYTVDYILEALEYFQKISYQYFYSRFGRGSNAEGTVWLGGGCGFLSKTIIYPLMGEKGYELADQIFQKSLPTKIYNEHHHDKDRSLRLAPHICKCTRYCGELYDMGMGRIEVIK